MSLYEKLERSKSFDNPQIASFLKDKNSSNQEITFTSPLKQLGMEFANKGDRISRGIKKGDQEIEARHDDLLYQLRQFSKTKNKTLPDEHKGSVHISTHKKTDKYKFSKLYMNKTPTQADTISNNYKSTKLPQDDSGNKLNIKTNDKLKKINPIKRVSYERLNTEMDSSLDNTSKKEINSLKKLLSQNEKQIQQLKIIIQLLTSENQNLIKKNQLLEKMLKNLWKNPGALQQNINENIFNNNDYKNNQLIKHGYATTRSIENIFTENSRKYKNSFLNEYINKNKGISFKNNEQIPQIADKKQIKQIIYSNSNSSDQYENTKDKFISTIRGNYKQSNFYPKLQDQKEGNVQIVKNVQEHEQSIINMLGQERFTKENILQSVIKQKGKVQYNDLKIKRSTLLNQNQPTNTGTEFTKANLSILQLEKKIQKVKESNKQLRQNQRVRVSDSPNKQFVRWQFANVQTKKLEDEILPLSKKCTDYELITRSTHSKVNNSPKQTRSRGFYTGQQILTYPYSSVNRVVPQISVLSRK